jgi:hypothetical protein
MRVAFVQIAMIDGLCGMGAELDQFKCPLLEVALLQEEMRPNLQIIGINVEKCSFSAMNN